MPVSSTTTHTLRSSEKLTLRQLRNFVNETVKLVPDETKVNITSYDSQRDGYSVSIIVTEGIV